MLKADGQVLLSYFLLLISDVRIPTNVTDVTIIDSRCVDHDQR